MVCGESNGQGYSSHSGTADRSFTVTLVLAKINAYTDTSSVIVS